MCLLIFPSNKINAVIFFSFMQSFQSIIKEKFTLRDDVNILDGHDYDYFHDYAHVHCHDHGHDRAYDHDVRIDSKMNADCFPPSGYDCAFI